MSLLTLGMLVIDFVKQLLNLNVYNVHGTVATMIIGLILLSAGRREM